MIIAPCYPAVWWGDNFPAYDVDAIGEGFDVSFTAQTSEPITHFAFGAKRPIGSPGTVRMSVQGVQYGAETQADGAEVYGWDTLLDPAVPTGNGDPFGVAWQALPLPLSLTAGQAYAFSFRAKSGTWDASNKARIIAAVGNVAAPRSLWPVHTSHTGGVASMVTLTPSFGYRTADAVYGDTAAGAVGGGVNHIGILITPPAPLRLKSVTSVSLKQTANPGPTIDCVLYRDPLGAREVIANSAPIEIDDAITNADSFRPYTTWFTDLPLMRAGTTYGVILRAASNLFMSSWTTGNGVGLTTDHKGVEAFNPGYGIRKLQGDSSSLSVFEDDLPNMHIEVDPEPGSSRPVLSSPYLIGDLR